MKRKNNKPNKQAKPSTVVEDNNTPVTEEVTTEAAPAESAEDTPVEVVRKPSMYMGTLIARYQSGELTESLYNLLHLNKDYDSVNFETLVAQDESTHASHMYPCYLLEGNGKYTDKPYCVVLNAHTYKAMAPGEQLFIDAFISSLSPKLLPSYCFDEQGKCLYDLNEPIDKLACFINACNSNPTLAGKNIPFKDVYERISKFFYTYRPKDTENRETDLIKEVTSDDMFE